MPPKSSNDDRTWAYVLCQSTATGPFELRPRAISHSEQDVELGGCGPIPLEDQARGLQSNTPAAFSAHICRIGWYTTNIQSETDIISRPYPCQSQSKTILLESETIRFKVRNKLSCSRSPRHGRGRNPMQSCRRKHTDTRSRKPSQACIPKLSKALVFF